MQVYDNGSEAVLVTCCSAAVRLWSLRRLAEPLASLPLLPYLPYGGGAGGGWSPAWRPGMALAPNGGAAAVVLGGGGPALYVVDLQVGPRGGGGVCASWQGGAVRRTVRIPFQYVTRASVPTRFLCARQPLI